MRAPPSTAQTSPVQTSAAQAGAQTGARRLPGLRLGAALLGTLLAGTLAGAVQVRVLVASGPQLSVRVSAPPAGLPGTDLTPAALSAAPPQAWTVGVAGGRLTLGGTDAGSASLYLASPPGGTVEIAGLTYRGGVSLVARGGAVQAINVADLEDYLRGVVAAEMPPSWPAEALRAQAIIARTYAASRLNPAASYDLCATESCQVYGGVRREQPSTDAAILATRAQVVSYAGKAAQTFFSADSGGYTASNAEAWGGAALPYLSAQPDPASQGPSSRWQLQVPLAQAASVAARYGVRVGTLQSLHITQVSPSGRTQAIRFDGAGGSAALSGAEAGGYLRSLGGKSLRVAFSGSDPLIIDGYGSGHGVGLSQWGAVGLARQGWTSLQILGFYYRGASLSTILNAGEPAADKPAAWRLLAVARLEAPARLKDALTVLTRPGTVQSSPSADGRL